MIRKILAAATGVLVVFSITAAGLFMFVLVAAGFIWLIDNPNMVYLFMLGIMAGFLFIFGIRFGIDMWGKDE